MSPEPDKSAETKEPLTIVKPQDELHIQLLARKLDQYNDFFASDRRAYQPPEIRLNNQRGYARILLERVLDQGEVTPDAVFEKLNQEWKEFFDVQAFVNATNLVATYCDPDMIWFLERSVNRVKPQSSQ